MHTTTSQDYQSQDAQSQDYRQRFFVNHSPVRGDVVKLGNTHQTIIHQKAYPIALQRLLGQMAAAASLLIGTLKIDGRLSLQLQADNTQDDKAQDSKTLLHWAMAETDSTGEVRALAHFDDDKAWQNLASGDEAFAALGAGVLFINIHRPLGDNSYQGIVEKVSDNLGDCLAHYQKQSAQIPTLIKLVADDTHAAGILVQLLPQSEADQAADPDLWHRISLLTSTLKDDELLELDANEILYRLYHEEDVVLPEPAPLRFGCTCSQDKSEAAIIQLGETDALNALDETGVLSLDCGFCGAVYRFDKTDVQALFA